MLFVMTMAMFGMMIGLYFGQEIGASKATYYMVPLRARACIQVDGNLYCKQ